jgi:PAS domain S-box-containing protein
MEGARLVSLTAQTLGSAIADPLLVADSGGRIAFMNAPALDAFGYSGDEVVGLPARELLPGFPAPSANGSRTGTSAADVEARRKDGTAFPVHASFGAISLDHELLCFALIRDLTGERRS